MKYHNQQEPDFHRNAQRNKKLRLAQHKPTKPKAANVPNFKAHLVHTKSARHFL